MNFTFDDWTLDGGQHRLLHSDEEVHVSPKALQLLSLLIERAPDAISKQEIYDTLWPSTFVSDTSLPTLVLELRTALEDDARNSRYIRTVHGFGYAFAAMIQKGARTRGERARYRLLIGGNEFPLGEGATEIGRTADAAIFLDEASVSRLHARITGTGSGATLEDLGSKNGTFLNGTRVSAPAPLHDRDVIRFGNVDVVFRDAAVAEPTRTMH